MEFVYDWIKHIVYFLLFTSLIKNLIGKEYQKYASLLFGLCLVLQLASPLIKPGVETNFDWLLGQKQLQLYEEENRWLAEESELGNSLETIVYEEAELLLREQTKQLVAREGYVLQELSLWKTKAEEGAYDTGQEQTDSLISGMTVWLVKEELGNSSKNGADTSGTWAVQQMGAVPGENRQVKAVESVSITEIVIRLEQEATGEKVAPSGIDTERPDDSPEELAMKKRLADFYDMEESHINVIIPVGSNT